MNNLEKRKAQLREYIEARAKASQGLMKLYRRNEECGAISFDVEDESMKAFMTTLLDFDQPKAKQNAEFTVLAANESALIAEQLLECIEALEAINLLTKNGNSTEIERSMSALADKILNKIKGVKL